LVLHEDTHLEVNGCNEYEVLQERHSELVLPVQVKQLVSQGVHLLSEKFWYDPSGQVREQILEDEFRK